MFASLLKIRLRSVFSGMFRIGNSKKRSAWGKALVGLLVLYLVGCIALMMVMLFSSLCEAFSAAGLDWFYFSFAGIVAFVLSFVGSVFAAKNQLYEATDNELLMSMPITPDAILLSRLASLLCLNVIYEAIVLIPAGAVYCWFNGITVMGTVCFVVCFVALPLLSMTFTGLGGYLIEKLTSIIPKKNVVETVFYVLFLAAYLFGYSRVMTYISKLVMNGASVAGAIKKAVYPMYMFGKAIADGDVISLVLFVLCCAAPAVVMYYILSRSYIKIMGTKKAAAKAVYKREKLKISSVKTALLRRELMHFGQSPMYIMNAAIGTIFAVVGAVALVVKRDLIIEYLAMYRIFLDISPAALVAAAVAMVMSMNLVSAPSVSIEGKMFWLIRSLPVSTKDILLAKVRSALVLSVPCSILLSVTASVVMGFSVEETAVAVLVPLPFMAFFALGGVVLNLRFPKLDWINEVYAVKQSAASMLSMLLNMSIIIAPCVLYALVLKDVMYADVFALIFAAVVTLLDWAMYAYLGRGGAKIFESL